MKVSRRNRPLAILLCLVALAGLYALFQSLSNKALDTASRVSEALEEWERKGLSSTVAWQTREFLARLPWLGPFRPVTPEDPLTACGVTVAGSCRSFPLTATNPGQLLSCLEEKMQEAEENNAAFQGRLFCSLSLIFCAVTLGVLVLLRCTARQGGSTRKDRLDTTRPSEAEEIETDCQDLSSDEYEDCQEETALYLAGTSQECTEDVVCDSTGNTSYSHDLSSEVYKDCTEDITVHHPESCQECKDYVASDPSTLAPGSVYPDDYYAKKKKKGKKNRAKKTVQADCEQDGGHWQAVQSNNKVRNDEGMEYKMKEQDKKKEAENTENKATKWSNIVKGQKEVANKCPKSSSGGLQRPGTKQLPKRCHAKGQTKAASTDASREAMRDQWREAKVKVLLQVPPQRRRHVIGRRGETVRLLRRTYPEVAVTVPSPSDPTSGHVALEGPKGQVASAAEYIMARLQAEEKNKPVTAVLEVEPALRGVVVGPGGERLLRLAEEYPRVRVTVPPPSNTNTRTVKLRGPPGEVAAVKASLEATLQKERRWREMRAARKTTKRRAPTRQ